MQRFAKDAAIKRKAKLGSILTFGGFGFLIISLVLSFRTESITILTLGSALIGALFSQVGIVISNKWGKRPRVDEIIDSALKGLDSRYALFHYDLGSNHVLFTPSGTFTLVPCPQEGVITFSDGKWWQTVQGKRRKRKKALKHIAADAQNDANLTMKKISRLIPDEDIAEVEPLLVFLHPDAQLKVDDTDPAAIHHKKLKQYLRHITGRGNPPTIVERLAKKLKY